MFDKVFVQDERVLLHHWDLLHTRFMLLARAGQLVLRGVWELPRLRDVLAHSIDELRGVEQELARFGSAPGAALTPAAAQLWQAAAEWVTALREWSVPPESWTASQLTAALARRQVLEAQFLDTVAAYPFGDEPDEIVADPMMTR